jgi:hypothetical protein
MSEIKPVEPFVSTNWDGNAQTTKSLNSSLPISVYRLDSHLVRINFGISGPRKQDDIRIVVKERLFLSSAIQKSLHLISGTLIVLSFGDLTKAHSILCKGESSPAQSSLEI